jgi:hypothetical protein
MVTAVPGLFCAGEMLDWEAPTGGYLLTGVFCQRPGGGGGGGEVDGGTDLGYMNLFDPFAGYSSSV